jgi:hypothetical protein
MSELITPALAKQLKGATPEVKLKAAELLNKIEQAKRVENAQNTFMGFVNYMWPAFINGRHHKIMAAAFEKIARGELKRLIINMLRLTCYQHGISGSFPTKKLFRQPTRVSCPLDSVVRCVTL